MNTKTALVILLIAAIAIGAYFILKPLPTPKLMLNNGPIIAFGDSLVYGFGSTENKDFVSLLSERIGEPIINLGVNGNTTKDGLYRIERVLGQKPRLVILLLGGNDSLRQVSQEETFQNLSSIIEQLEANGAVVLLLGVQGGVYNDPYKAQFEALAKKYDTGYVPNVMEGIFGNKALTSDPIHPNDAGYKKIADKVYPVLKDMLGK